MLLSSVDIGLLTLNVNTCFCSLARMCCWDQTFDKRMGQFTAQNMSADLQSPLLMESDKLHHRFMQIRLYLGYSK